MPHARREDRTASLTYATLELHWGPRSSPLTRGAAIVKVVSMRVCVILATLHLLAACAVGNKHSYHAEVAYVPETGSGPVSLATHDQRPYVISGKKAPEFVGVSRGGYGNPFDVTTENGRPLAEAMTQAVANTLSQKGFRSIPVTVNAAD